MLAALSVAAVSLFAASVSAQAPTIARGFTEKVTIKTTPKRDRTKPYTFTTSGKIVPPASPCAPGKGPTKDANRLPTLWPPGTADPRYCVSPGVPRICTGTVTVRVQKRHTTISTRRVNLEPDCSYSSTVSFHSKLRTRRGVLSFRARFQGNALLLPKSSETVTARAG